MNRLRKKRTGDTEVSTEWMTTYSDMVTLLLAFFVILFSFSTIDAQKFEAALLSLQEALGLLKGGRTVNPEQLTDLSGFVRNDKHVRMLELEQLRQTGIMLERALSESDLKDAVSLNMEERGLIIRFTDQVLFDTGEAQLRDSALAILDTVAGVLKNTPNHIRVEGHTDDRPINTPQFPSNWELSTSRATNVLRYLAEEHSMRPDRLSAAGYGEWRPVAANDGPEGWRQNRRVDIILLRLSAAESEPQ